MRDLGPVAGIAGGAIGEPGRRSFYIQLDTDDGRLWFLLEKQQLSTLAERILEVLRELPAPDRIKPPEIAEPTEVTFRVGDIAIGPGAASFTVVFHPLEAGEGEPVEFEVEHAMMGGMGHAALRVVAAGRPQCQFCNLPKDPEGHICPATNGHRGYRLDA